MKEPRFLSYYRTDSLPPSRSLSVRSMGIHEYMPAGLINHGGGDCPYLFMWFHGPASVYSEDGPVDAEGHAILWSRGAWHRYGNETERWDHSWINVTGDALDWMLPSSGLPLDVPMRFDAGDLFTKYLGLIHEELHRHASPDVVVLEGFFRAWIRELSRRAGGQSGASPSLPAHLAELRRFIDTGFAHPLRLEDLAERVHLSVSQLCAQFKRFLGVAPMQYVQRVRMQRAAFLLGDHSSAVYQVAERVGIPDALYFSRVFRKHFGVSPRAWRQQAARR